ncbi:MAG: hypothetical protein IPK58_16590 [Acidobacteria bacterium]|nr:hypothetical protein [Acidobacteriota bacterium]
MKGFVRDVLLSDSSLKRGLFKPSEVTRYVDEHTSAARDHTYQVWTLLMLELWFREFID